MSGRHAKWIRWLRIIRADLAGLVEWRDEYDRAVRLLASLVGAGVRDAAETAVLLPESCVQAMAMGVRRQLKRGSRNITLAGLLEDMAVHPHVSATAAELFSGFETEREDLAMLRRRVRRVETFTDRAIAHVDRRRTQPPSMDELTTALAELVRSYDRYAKVLGEPAIDRTN